MLTKYTQCTPQRNEGEGEAALRTIKQKRTLALPLLKSHYDVHTSRFFCDVVAIFLIKEVGRSTQMWR
jgi:hypothetical protein